MLQLVYISTATPGQPSNAIDTILAASRRNNARDAITGLLYADGKRFLQALEGPEAAVEAAYARIKADPRHRAAVILSRRTIDAREFGEWDMAYRAPGNDAAGFMSRISLLARDASPSVRATFESFAETRRAA
ncbi:BLUF domain-containing protein [Sphingomonas baiyangensis]|uniref:BLUF domain-containing protein n=1 Tax=Sphingomonas baiyangensis TaxID=2572576 RepID=A0A4U1L260_9SPHN|nr:BLUF domain-containing protein [Sphingomonas baiyangensis]TKD50065.1 BLUF domain-containing protein [Sphingomonas baiyangensis]